jgi:hypothetical protein
MSDDSDVTTPHRPLARAGNDDLARLIGAGGFGEVFEAKHHETGFPDLRRRYSPTRIGTLPAAPQRHDKRT